MKLTGRIHYDCPIIGARIKHGVLMLGGTGPEQLVVDTGFTGAIALPPRLLKRLALQFIATDTFMLATGEDVDLPAYAGTVQIGRRRLRTWFVPGDYLVGMEFMRSVFSRMVLDFDKNSVMLA